MPKTKAKPTEIVQFEIGVKNRKPFTVHADAWNFGNAYDAHAVFMLDGDVVFVIAHQKWDYIRRVGSRAKEAANVAPTT